MGLYTVTGPCVVGTVHHVRVPDQPIEVADDVAADLVASGVLIPYPPKPAETEPARKPPARGRRKA
jgi:hypothetical protein